MSNTASTLPTLCIGILTMNESQRIRACLDSARFADQVLVVDSGSSDGTRELASQWGAEVHLHADWQGFAEQRNRLLVHCRCDYIFFLDADEVIPDGLREDILTALRSGRNAVWEIQWEQVAFGRPLRAMKTSNGIPRLFRRDNIECFEGVVHEGARLRQSNTPVLPLRHRLLHFSRETIYGSLLKLAQYAQLGAIKRAQKGQRGGIWRGFASALAIFIKLYVLRRGFLCGPQGFLYCLFVALECFFRYVALRYDGAELLRDKPALR